jgi:hypothetical protein
MTPTARSKGDPRGAVAAAAGEDRQVPQLTIFKPEKGRNHAKNAKIVKIANQKT